MTDNHKNILLSVAVFMTGILITMGTTFCILYRLHMDEERARLSIIAQSQAKLLEAVARFDAQHSTAYPGGSFEATLSQFREAHRRYKEFGKTGGFDLARRKGEHIEFIMTRKKGDMPLPGPIPFDSAWAEPMRRALLGESGCLQGVDHRGVMVLAAYEPVTEMNLGLVAKIDLRELKQPFVTAALVAGLLSLIIAFTGAAILLKANPFSRRLVESGQRYRFLVENQNDFVVELDPEKRLIFASLNYLKTFDLDESAYVGTSIFSLIHEEDRAHAAQSLDALIEPPFASNHEVRVRTADGWRWLECSARSILDNKGSIREIISVGRDITQRKEAEKQLNLTQFAVDKSKSAFFWLNTESQIVYVNEHACGSLGYTRDELTGKYVWDIDPDFRPEHWAEFWPKLKQQTSITLETRHKRKDGTVFPVEITANYILYDGQEHDFAYARDITERKHTEAELKKHREHLEDLVFERTALAEKRAAQLQQLALELSKAEDQERRRLATILHDDIQQLLALLKLRVKILLPPDHLSDHLDDHLDDQIHVQVSGGTIEKRQSIERLIDQIIDKSRNISYHLSPPILYQHGLSSALEWLADEMETRLGLRVTVEITPDIDPESPVLASILFRSARELLFNVVKHSGTDAACITLWTKVDQLLLRVSDSGKGFDPAPVRQSWRRNAGFGLFSIEDRVSMLGGRMEIEAAPGQGCAVTMIVPSHFAAESGDVIPKPAPEPAPGQREAITQAPIPATDRYPRIHILIVDDHELMCEALANMLQAEPDFNIVGLAHDGREAVRLAAERQPNVILMDISMPGMNGIDATAGILSLTPDIRIIGLSMHKDATMQQKILDAGACAYLTKGGSSEELIETVRRVFYGNRPSP